MKEKWMRAAALLCACLMLLTAAGCGGTPSDTAGETEEAPLLELTVESDDLSALPAGEEGYVLCEKNDALALYVNPEEAAFYAEDLVNGTRWYSCPPDAEEDMYAFGTYMEEMKSLFIVDYVVASVREVGRFNTYTDAVLMGDFAVQQIDKGFKATFRFADYNMIIPIAVTLESDHVSARIVTAEMQMGNEDILSLSLSLLPYFGAGGLEEEGYFLLPDGSGALMHFNNGKSACEPYVRPVYGTSADQQGLQFSSNEEQQAVRLPLFGIKKSTGACLVVIDQGEAESTINAYPNEQITGYANAYAGFTLRDSLLYSIDNNETEMYETGAFSVPEIGVSCYPVGGAEADYADMAAAYRSLLEKQNKLPVAVGGKDSALYLDLYAGVTKTVSTLGIRTQQVVPLTTAEEAQQILRLLQEKGVDDIVVRYSSWNSDELKGKLTDTAKANGKLVSRKLGLKDLQEMEGVTLYPGINRFQRFYSGGLLDAYLASASNLAGVAYRLKKTTLSIGDEVGKTFYLMPTADLTKRLGSLFSVWKKAGYTGLALSDAVNTLYADYTDETYKRGDMARLTAEALKNAETALLLDNPNLYALSYADELINIPTTSCGNHLLDEDVPFLGMVLSGAVRYAAAPFNAGNDENAFLHALENGAMPTYYGIYRATSLLADTDASYLYAANYATWLDEAVEQYAAVKAIEEAAEGTALCDHARLTADVVAVTYQNGAKVYINYGDEAYNLPDGKTVSAEGYLLTKGE